MSRVYKHISQLLTLEGARKKKGRHPLEKDLGIWEDACIVVDKAQKVLWLGATSALPETYHRFPSQSCEGETWFPAPVECHTHLVFAGSREKEYGMRCAGQSYLQIAEKGGGILSTVKATRKALPEDLLRLAMNRIESFASNGVAAVEIKSGYGLTLESEIRMLEVVREAQRRTNVQLVPTFLPAHAVPPEFKGKDDDYVEEICHVWIPEIAERQLATFFDAFVEKGYFNIKQTEKMVLAAKDAGLRVKLHVDQFNAFGGAELAVRMEAVSADHLDATSDAAVQALAKSDTVAVLAPAASLFTGTSYPPARKLIDAGARVALTTDFNPGTSPTTNLGLVATIAASQMKMTLPEALVALTYGAAAAVGLEDEFGSITIGKRLRCARIQAPHYEAWAYGFGSVSPEPLGNH
jgi:imidazolonepropionase